MKLEVGTRLQMTLKRGVQPLIYYTALIGYVSGEYLLMKIPLENGLSVPILAGERVALRVFFRDERVFVCLRRGIGFSTAPRFYMHLTFPNEIQATALRKAVRVNVELPVQIKGASACGTITDISVAGAQITADSALGEPEAKNCAVVHVSDQADQSGSADRNQRNDPQSA
ncbi:flagellar brake protein [Undibacterium arcticum]